MYYAQLLFPALPALYITAVSNALNGYVAMVGGNVVFVPNPNFFGTARFSYTVTDQYGQSASATATLQIAAVNDAPTPVGETIGGAVEDQALLIMANALLANDADVENYYYEFDSYLSNQDMRQRPFLCLSGNDSAWRYVA